MIPLNEPTKYWEPLKNETTKKIMAPFRGSGKESYI